MSFTDIFAAIREGTVEDVRYLVEENGADVNAKDNHGDTPLHDAAFKDIEVFKFLISKGADINANHQVHPIQFSPCTDW